MTTETYISLKSAAEELGLHYMTVYRYVRTGRLPAVKVDGEWRIRRSDLEFLKSDDDNRPAQPREAQQPLLEQRMIAGDEPGSWQIIERALASGADVEEIYVKLLIPAMQSVGDRWERDDLSVLDEHQATAVATRLVARLGPMFRRRGRRRGVIIIGAPSGDPHALAPAFLADLLRGRRFEVLDLGGNTPAESFIELATKTDGVKAVAISATAPDNLDVVRRTVDDIRAACGPDLPILVGGNLIPDQATADAVGSDGWAAGTVGVLDLFESLAKGSGQTDDVTDDATAG